MLANQKIRNCRKLRWKKLRTSPYDPRHRNRNHSGTGDRPDSPKTDTESGSSEAEDQLAKILLVEYRIGRMVVKCGSRVVVSQFEHGKKSWNNGAETCVKSGMTEKQVRPSH